MMWITDRSNCFGILDIGVDEAMGSTYYWLEARKDGTCKFRLAYDDGNSYDGDFDEFFESGGRGI